MEKNRLPWEDSQTHKVFAAIMVLGCLMIAVGFVAPFIAEPQVAGYQIFRGAFKAMKKLLETLSDRQNARLMDSALGRVMLEVLLIVIINGLCFGLLAIASVYSVIKYVVSKRSAAAAMTLPVFLSFLTLAWVAMRLSQADRAFAELFMNALSLSPRRSGSSMAWGLGAYLYPLGMVLGLFGTNAMHRIEKRARKLHRAGAEKDAPFQPLPAAVSVETFEPSEPATTAQESISVELAPTIPEAATRPMRPAFWTKKVQLILLAALAGAVMIAAAAVALWVSKDSGERPKAAVDRPSAARKEAGKAEKAEAQEEEEGVALTFETDEDEGIAPPEEFEDEPEEAAPPGQATVSPVRGEAVLPEEAPVPGEAVLPERAAEAEEAVQPVEAVQPEEVDVPTEAVDPVQIAQGEGERWEVFRAYLDKKDPFLNLRSGPGGALVAKLTDGTLVNVLSTQGSWRGITVADGDHAGKSGFVHTCCVKPVGALDLYRARLSATDHRNSKGRPLASASGVIQQDRANFHKFGRRDAEDTDDLTFVNVKKRGWLSKELDRVKFDRTETGKAIANGTPRVEVIVWESEVSVTLLEP